MTRVENVESLKVFTTFFPSKSLDRDGVGDLADIDFCTPDDIKIYFRQFTTTTSW